MTTQEKIEVMKAYAEGKKIQVRDKTLKVWIDWGTCGEPEWDWGINDYRIKPKDKYRSYKDTDKMIEDFKERFNVEVPPYAMPMIWIRHKGSNRPSLVDKFDIKSVVTYSGTWDMSELRDRYTYLDGSPCGMKEEA